MSWFCKGVLYSLKKPFAAAMLLGVLVFGLDFGLAGATSREPANANTLNSLQQSGFSDSRVRYSSVLVMAAKKDAPESSYSTHSPDLWHDTLEKLVRFVNKQETD